MAYDRLYLALGATWLILGMIMGLAMGAAQDFTLAPAHAHINLVGFACHAVFGAALRIWPALARSRLAAAQFWLFVLATPVFVAALVIKLKGGPEAPLILGSLAVAAGAAMFGVMAWRNVFAGPAT